MAGVSDSGSSLSNAQRSDHTKKSTNEIIESEQSEKKDPSQKENERGGWGHSLQFILTCLGAAVGLGNIWRFPSKAYENGGSVFLIPYLTCGLFFGLPVVYGEFVIGQYCGVAAVKAFKRYAPAFQGLGWAMVIQEIFISTYYTVILTWSAVYIAFVISGNSYLWNQCGNSWNTENCVTVSQLRNCREINATMPYYDPVAGNCTIFPVNTTASSTMEFFERFITRRSSDILDINELYWFVALALFIMWTLIGLALIKGVKILGYLSYVTATLPYVIVLILFGRGITLDNAWEGVSYFLEPRFEKILDPSVWAAALQQMAFSLTIGTGALVTMASYNKQRNNCFRDALIVVVGDTLMSVIGGVGIFSVLGYMSKEIGKPVEQLIESGTSLAFVLYPEAMNLMPTHYIWEFLFFLMFLLLGFSTETVMVQTISTCLSDQFAFFGRHKWIPVVGTCFLFFSLGLVMCTDAGWYWFLLSDNYTGTVGLTTILGLQFIVCTWIYGFPQLRRDLARMWGEPKPLSSVRRWIGRQSPLWLFSWTAICPICALMITFIQARDFFDDMPFAPSINGKEYIFPKWAEWLGWLSTLGPLLALPIFFFYNWWRFSRTDRGLIDLFKNLPSLHIRGTKHDDEEEEEEEEETTASSPA